jgi:hypothetical protein
VAVSITQETQLRVEQRACSIDEAIQAREAFITRASTFVRSAISINGSAIADGTPGPVTRRLRESYTSAALGSLDESLASSSSRYRNSNNPLRWRIARPFDALAALARLRSSRCKAATRAGMRHTDGPPAITPRSERTMTVGAAQANGAEDPTAQPAVSWGCHPAGATP